MIIMMMRKVLDLVKDSHGTPLELMVPLTHLDLLATQVIDTGAHLSS